MTARYIDLGPDAVLAVLDGRKTRFTVPMAADGDVPFRCGDAVRVREDHAAHWGARHPRGRIVADVDVVQHDGRIHRATADDPLHVHYAADAHGPEGRCDGPAKYRPAAEMPDWGVRLVLHVASVRVGRLHDLTEADAEAEGCAYEIWDQALAVRDYSGNHPSGEPRFFCMWGTLEGTPGYVHEDEIWRASFRTLWEAEHGPGSWEANPLVASVAFRAERLP